jgi:hypothetical protein
MKYAVEMGSGAMMYAKQSIVAHDLGGCFRDEQYNPTVAVVVGSLSQMPSSGNARERTVWCIYVHMYVSVRS